MTGEICVVFVWTQVPTGPAKAAAVARSIMVESNLSIVARIGALRRHTVPDCISPSSLIWKIARTGSLARQHAHATQHRKHMLADQNRFSLVSLGSSATMPHTHKTQHTQHLQQAPILSGSPPLALSLSPINRSAPSELHWSGGPRQQSARAHAHHATPTQGTRINMDQSRGS